MADAALGSVGRSAIVFFAPPPFARLPGDALGASAGRRMITHKPLGYGARSYASRPLWTAGRFAGAGAARASLANRTRRPDETEPACCCRKLELGPIRPSRKPAAAVSLAAGSGIRLIHAIGLSEPATLRAAAPINCCLIAPAGAQLVCRTKPSPRPSCLRPLGARFISEWARVGARPFPLERVQPK